MFIEHDMARKKDTAGGWVKTPVALMIIRETEINTWQRARGEFVGSGRSNVGKT